MSITIRCDSVGIHDGGSAARDHGPDFALGIQDGELERSSGAGVEFLDVGFLLGEVAAEGRGPDHGWPAVELQLAVDGLGGVVEGGVARDGPLGPADGVGGLVEFGGHVEVVDGGRAVGGGVEADEGVDFEIGEVEVLQVVARH